MRFLDLYISGFGKFHDTAVSFEDGLNVIYGKNEAGKSTIHTFIRGMLFGIERQRGRASRNDLYTRYEPWESSGTYEGQIRLEHKEHIYRIEHCCDKAGLSYDERKTKRRELAGPVMNAMKVWMETEGIKYSPNSQIGKAITYAYTRWDNMMGCLEDGRLLWDNNLAENVIRPITLGRKNYLFCGNDDAAVLAAIIYSLISSCKAVNVDPREWMIDVLRKLPIYKESKKNICELLPKYWEKSLNTANS